MKILSLINETKLFKETTPVRELFFSPEDHKRLLSLGEVTYIPEEDVHNIREPEILSKFQKILPTIDVIYQDGCFIPEDILTPYTNVKAIVQMRAPFPKYSAEFYINALERGVHFLSESPAYAPSVAEFALGLSINLLRNITEYNVKMRNGEEKFSYCVENLSDKGLYGKSVGILGFGRIGKMFLSLLKPFNVNVFIYDPFVSDETAAAYGVTKCDDINDLLPQIDLLVLMAIPHESNRHIIDATTLRRLKKGAAIVNVARAHLVNYEDLIVWLRSGNGKAALDVFEKEPLAKDSELRQIPNLLLTPHRAGGILDSYRLIGHSMIDDFYAIKENKMPTNMLRLTKETMDVYFNK